MIRQSLNWTTLRSFGSSILTAQAPAQEWTRFRGPNGSGISHAKTVPTKISDADLNWKVELPGTGHSSPVLWGERVFLTCTGDKSGGFSVLCLNVKDGKTIWKRDFCAIAICKTFTEQFCFLDADGGCRAYLRGVERAGPLPAHRS